MKMTMVEFLALANKPARLTMEQAAWLLGFSVNDISILLARGLLKPLGHPARNGQKFFWAVTLEQLKQDERWLARATDAVVGHWWQKNNRRTGAQNGANSRALADARECSKHQFLSGRSETAR